jgi:hypothetical protein
MKKYTIKNWLICSLVVTAFFSCDPDPIIGEEVDRVTDFHPFEEGKFWVYQVDSTIYDDNGATIINTSGFVREEIKEQLSEDQQFTTHVLERSWKRNEMDEWAITDIWSIALADGMLVKTEENLRFLKIATPIIADQEWEGNLFDENIEVLIADDAVQVYRDWDYKILATGQSENIGGVDYTDILVVQESDSENVIERRFSMTKYARNIGLVERTMGIYDSQCNVCEEPWEEKAERGFGLREVLIDHN